MQGCRRISLAHIMATGLALAGCSDPPDNVSLPKQPVDPLPVGEQVDASVQVDVAPDKKAEKESAPTGEKEATRKPLDLSMPPQPALVPEPGDNIDASRDHLLPDLFQQDQEPDDGRSMNFKGRVLMREGEEQSLDSLEGGQLIIEKKTR